MLSPNADFVLTYHDELEGKKGKDDTDEKRDKRKKKRDTFVANCMKAGLEFEHQDCSVINNTVACSGWSLNTRAAAYVINNTVTCSGWSLNTRTAM